MVTGDVTLDEGERAALAVAWMSDTPLVNTESVVKRIVASRVAAAEAEVGHRCQCGHSAFMHGDTVGDTGCRSCGCQRYDGVRVCGFCGCSSDADVEVCPECQDKGSGAAAEIAAEMRWHEAHHQMIEAVRATEAREAALRAERDDAVAQVERFRSHVISDPEMADLHANAKAYSLANTALREKYGYEHSTTLAWLIEQGHIGPMHIARAEGEAALRAVATEALDDLDAQCSDDDRHGAQLRAHEVRGAVADLRALLATGGAE